MLLEFQDLMSSDLIPYLISIGLICSLTYAYAAHLYVAVDHFLVPAYRGRVAIVLPQERIVGRTEIHHWLTRSVKRKEAPDGDSGDCHSLIGIRTLSNQGGLLWSSSMYSPTNENIF
ncbi:MULTISPECIES: hypothetical protein [Paenibacillus]|uniref:hypothetical protein n=1 Tax=Paenibacillus TaxID=44249 RepID=UPI002281090F|nr:MULTISPECIES: hypothetical protein [Paenibacillus]MCY7484043.1 hypothetical protein [Paenibacillus alvei]